MNIGDKVSFMLQCGPGSLRIVEDEYKIVYGRRKRFGIVKQIIGDTAIIDTSGEIVGMPIAKVEIAH